MAGWTAGPPTGLIQSVSQSIGSGGTVVLIPANVNVKGVKLWSASISSAAVSPMAGLSASFIVEDTITDSDGNQYLACEIGLPNGVAWASHNTVSQDQEGIVVPPGASVSLNNGGAFGTVALRRCSATLIYSILYPGGGP